MSKGKRKEIGESRDGEIASLSVAWPSALSCPDEQNCSFPFMAILDVPYPASSECGDFPGHRISSTESRGRKKKQRPWSNNVQEQYKRDSIKVLLGRASWTDTQWCLCCVCVCCISCGSYGLCGLVVRWCIAFAPLWTQQHVSGRQ